ncbi:Ecm13p LALA0_S02e10660g [Lachancea lanzarotensis]|uniref:LALA0S02e10660g1_1 n=1 Tax=Lachancea lanzarotensis TaxID=1245769 RepID=A0A0C7N021_9SACH|nr:uncharacterized protein LALA0_S02e10660g [Lachancea lanzarotensis]CEP61272.1 LALA0S02e10660g1_1 [Lachancea lanzarotensis]
MYQLQNRSLLASDRERALLTQQARSKLIRCAHSDKNTDLNLRILVGHANLLDRLALEETQCDVQTYNSTILEEFQSDSESSDSGSDSGSDSELESDASFDEEEDFDSDLEDTDEYCYRHNDNDANEFQSPAVPLYEIAKHIYRPHDNENDNGNRSMRCETTTTVVTLANDDDDDEDDDDDDDNGNKWSDVAFDDDDDADADDETERILSYWDRHHQQQRLHHHHHSAVKIERVPAIPLMC